MLRRRRLSNVIAEENIVFQFEVLPKEGVMKNFILTALAITACSASAFGQLGGGGGFELPDIAIASVQPGGLDEVIVLENRDETPFDLAGWTLTVGAPTQPNQQQYQFAEPCVLMPGAQVRVHSGIANFFRAGGACEGQTSDIVWQSWFALNDNAGVVTLTFADFTISQFGYPATSVVVNEIEINPGGGEAGREWVELYNAGKTPILLDGWSVDVANGVSIKLEIPLEGVLAPGAYRLIEVGIEFLNNQAEHVEVRRVDGSVVDQTPEAGLMDTLGDDRCWARIPNAGPGWTFQTCTREAANKI